MSIKDTLKNNLKSYYKNQNKHYSYLCDSYEYIRDIIDDYVKHYEDEFECYDLLGDILSEIGEIYYDAARDCFEICKQIHPSGEESGCSDSNNC